MITAVGAFILLLCPLIFVHELGHFLFARLFNVRCDAFSLGFGPKIFKKKVGETEYCVSVIPLGGYVKLLGQDPNEKIAPEFINRTLGAQEPWKRFLIYVAGPLFNFLFAIFIFSLIMMIGEPHVNTMLERIPPGSQAAVAGFKSGDLITAVDNVPVNKFEEVMEIISKSINKTVVMRVRRDDVIKEISTTPTATLGFSIYGEIMDVGTIEGLFSSGRHPVIGVSNPKSLAAVAGLKTGDEIVTFNGKPVLGYEDLEIAVETAKNGDFHIGIAEHALDYWSPDKRPAASIVPTKTVRLPAGQLLKLGIHSSELFAASFVKGSPVELAGLKPGDRVVGIDGVKLQTFSDLRERVQRAGEKKGALSLEFERAGVLQKTEVTPNMNESKDVSGKVVKHYLIGLYPLFIAREPGMFVERILNPFSIAIQAWTRTIDLSVKTVISMKKLITREVSVGNLGGPLLIGKLANDSFERGVAHFLKMMALISISLCIFNVLPVPVLDGGHITLLFVEVLRGKPITMRQSELVQQVGVTLILLLLVVVMYNDISRVGIPAIRRIME